MAADSSDTVPPCTPNATPLAQRFPPTSKLRSAFKNSTDSVELQQDIFRYSDVATVTKLIAATEAGLSCHTAKVDGVALTLQPGPAPAVAGLDVYKRWDAAIATKNLVISYLLISRGSTVELLSFLAAKSAAAAVDPRAVLAVAAKKLVAH